MDLSIFSIVYQKIFLKLNLHILRNYLLCLYNQQSACLPLWRPVFLGLGIALYFQFDFDISLNLLIISLLVLFVLYFFIYLKTFSTLTLFFIGGLFLSGLGYLAADLKAIFVSAPIIQSDIKNRSMSGQVAKIERFDNRRRILLEDVIIDKIERHNTPMKIRLSLPESHFSDEISIGSYVTTRGSLRPPPLPSVPGMYDFARNAWFDQIGAIGYSTKPLKVNKNNPNQFSSQTFNIKHVISKFRDELTQKLRYQNDIVLLNRNYDFGSLRAALVTGDRSGIDQETYDVIRNAGLAHLLAISGLHMGLIAMLIFSSLRFSLALVPRIALNYNIKKVAAFSAIFAAGLYMIISGNTIPSERAFIMTSVAFSGIIFDRNVVSLRTVSLAAFLVLLFQPESLLTASFQLSFGAVICLVAAYETKKMRAMIQYFNKSFIYRILGYLVLLSLTTTIASLATAPLALFHFGQVASYGLIANLISVPIMGFVVMPAAVLSIILMPFGIEFIGFEMMDIGLSFILDVAHWVSSFDGAIIIYGGLDILSAILIALSVVWLCLWRGNLRFLAISIIPFILFSIHNPIKKQLFIDGGGALVGYHAAGHGSYLSKLSGNGFIKKIWLGHWGSLEIKSLDEFQQTVNSAPQLRSYPICSSNGCQFNINDTSIIYATTLEVAYEACSKADVLIYTSSPLKYQACERPLIIDKNRLKKYGGHSITTYKNHDDLIMESVIGKDSHKPWHVARYN